MSAISGGDLFILSALILIYGDTLDRDKRIILYITFFVALAFAAHGLVGQWSRLAGL